VVSSDNDSASTSLFPLFDIVYVIKALPGVGKLELLSQIVVTDASSIDHGFWGEDVLDRPRDQNAYEIGFGNGYALQHREQRFAQLPQQYRRPRSPSQLHRNYRLIRTPESSVNRGSYEHLSVFPLGQNGIVRFESIFFQKLLSTSDLEVEEGISHTKDGVRHRG